MTISTIATTKPRLVPWPLLVLLLFLLLLLLQLLLLVLLLPLFSYCHREGNAIRLSTGLWITGYSLVSHERYWSAEFASTFVRSWCQRLGRPGRCPHRLWVSDKSTTPPTTREAYKHWRIFIRRDCTGDSFQDFPQIVTLLPPLYFCTLSTTHIGIYLRFSPLNWFLFYWPNKGGFEGNFIAPWKM